LLLTSTTVNLAYPDKQDPTSLPASTVARIKEATDQNKYDDSKPWTIGVPMEYNIAELSPLVKQAWIDALELLKNLGHKIISISLPTTKAALSAYYVLAPAEASSNLAKYDGIRYGARGTELDGHNGVLYAKTRSEGFGSEVKRRLLLGSYSLSADAIDNYFIQAQKVRRLVQKDFNQVFNAPHPLLQQSMESQLNASFEWENGPGMMVEEPDAQAGRVDLILCPTAPTPPPRLADIAEQTPVESYINDVFTVPASMAGLPALNVPWGDINDPDPSTRVGLQVIGQFGYDHQVLGLGRSLTRTLRETN
jgi:aspartyl-tRNA(Asn)/glutamyl-tRNA(Gln) amidotransferase subunit A